MIARAESQNTKTHLSKSRYVAGLQCQKMLWWQVYEPEAADAEASQVLIDRGNEVGRAAREFVPGGVLIDLPPYKVAERVAATAEAIASRASIIYEASFIADGVFVSVDILERRKSGYTLTEVKATLDVKEHHIPDVAVQLHVLERAGITVKRVEIMHLNRDCRHPDFSNLFVRQDVTDLAQQAARSAQKLIRALAAALGGPLPDVATGDHCTEPYECPFMERCWPKLPQHHVSSLYRITAKNLQKLIDSGCETLLGLPDEFVASGIARRQIDSVKRGSILVEPGLTEALEAIVPPVAFLDFETIAPAIPAWPGCAPYEKVPVQFSCHLAGPSGVTHRAWIAEGASDPREPFARALIDACDGAATILAYSAPFEKGRIAVLIERFPKLAPKLARINDRIQDLLPIIRNNVYHPDFNGSFSIKDVLPALVPGMGYADLEIKDGGTASAALEAMILGTEMSSAEKAELREQLLAYCECDTFAMVRLYERLKTLAGCQASKS